MREAATSSEGAVSRFGLAIVVTIALFWSSITFIAPGMLHADEAVQWSLAKNLSEGTPYSTHQDKFHGPTLATALLISAKLTGTAPMDMSEHYLRGIVSVFLGLMAAAALVLPGVGKDGFVNSKDSELNPEMLSGVRNLKDNAKRHCQRDIEQGNIL